jgi:rhamnose utilization protein RhaD (predicted bifunctional aldolase and dehydrogenase)
MKSVINEFCTRIGRNRLLVQGAGGNVSWKQAGILWVKASGACIADADKSEIFVPVELGKLSDQIRLGNFDIDLRLHESGGMRPSIEVMLHAMMRFTVVVHLHAVPVLAKLVQARFKEDISGARALGKFCFVSYAMPGAALAKGIHDALVSSPDANVVFMGNHGILVGGESVHEVEKAIDSICAFFEVSTFSAGGASSSSVGSFYKSGKRFIAFPDSEVQQLALDDSLFCRLEKDWALYPDHVVFLGACPLIFDSEKSFMELEADVDLPDLVFIRNTGVFVSDDFGSARSAQLICYFDVLSRLRNVDNLVRLTEFQVEELLGWEAEKYRQKRSNLAG